MKKYLFFTKDGITHDMLYKQTHNMQILGDGIGSDVNEALKDFKNNHTYLSTQSYKDIFAVETVGDVIMNLEL